MQEVILTLWFVMQAVTTVYLVRKSRDRCPLLAGTETITHGLEEHHTESKLFAKSKSLLASSDFHSADLQIFCPNASNMWRPREISLDVTCACGRRTCFRMPEPFPEGADDTLRCTGCGRIFRQLGDVIRERGREFAEYLSELHGRN